MWKQIVKWKIFVLMDLFLVLLGSNSIDLLWFKGGWFLLFLQIRGKWCLLILGGFPKIVLIIKLFYIKEICWYSLNKLIFHKCLMCTLTICFIENLWDNLNLFKLVCVNISLYFWRIMNGLFLWVYWICFENLWQVVIKTSVLYLVLSKGQSYCS